MGGRNSEEADHNGDNRLEVTREKDWKNTMVYNRVQRGRESNQEGEQTHNGFDNNC